MLILTRKVGESIIVGKDIRVSILEIKGRQVRVGVQAPHSVSIHREEVYRSMRDRDGPSPTAETPKDRPLDSNNGAAPPKPIAPPAESP